MRETRGGYTKGDKARIWKRSIISGCESNEIMTQGEGLRAYVFQEGGCEIKFTDKVSILTSVPPIIFAPAA
jgi:hypothetical protein